MNDESWLVEYWWILIPFVFYSVLLLVSAVRPGRRISLYNSLLAVYALSLLANMLTGLYYEHSFRVDGLLYFTAATYLFIHPFRRIDVNAFGDLPEINMRAFYAVSAVLIAISLVGILDSINNLSNTLYALQADDISVYRSALASSQTLTAAEVGITGVLAQWSQSVYIIMVTLFFIGVIKKASKVVLILLFICSLWVVGYFLLQAGRTGVVFYVACWAFNYFIFHRFLPAKSRATFRRYAVVLLALMLVPFLIITLARFSAGYGGVQAGSNTWMVAVLDYLGQGIVNFDVFYRSGFDHFSYGVQAFPLFYRVLYALGFTTYDYYQMYADIRVLLPDTWMAFGTFLRDWWYNFGPWGTILVGIAFNFLMKKVDLSLRRRVTARYVLWLYVGYSMVLFGMISLNLAGMGANFTLLLVLLVRIESPTRNSLPNRVEHPGRASTDIQTPLKKLPEERRPGVGPAKP